MKRREFEAIGKRLLPDLPPGFVAHGDLLFIRPIDHTLRAIQFDGSSFDKNIFYVNIFLQPLCVPAETIYFSLGFRLVSGTQFWDATSPSLIPTLSAAIKREALPFLMPLHTIGDVAKAGISLHHSGDPGSEEAVGFAFARAGEVEPACKHLNHLLEMLSGWVEWERQVIARTKQLLKLLTENPAEAEGQLATWEEETIRNLKLEKFR